MTVGQDFQNYYVKHLGKSSLDLHNIGNHIENSMTPYILEEREMRRERREQNREKTEEKREKRKKKES